MAQIAVHRNGTELPLRMEHTPDVLRLVEIGPELESRGAVGAKSGSVHTPRARFVIARATGTPPSRAYQRIACRYLLSGLLPHTAGMKYDCWALDASLAGAPLLLCNSIPSSFRVSIAHSGVWLTVGVALHADIGVDIERIRPRKNLAAMATYLGWKNQTLDLAAFISLWTLWESCVKISDGNVLHDSNPAYLALSQALPEHGISRAGRLNWLEGRIAADACFSIVLRTRFPQAVASRELAGFNQPW